MSALTCPQCGASLPTQTAGGLCPACLLKLGFQSQPNSAALAETMEHTPGAAGAFEPPVERRLPEPGEQFGGYSIVRTLGKGGMGAVFEADQLETGRRVALKVLKHSLDSQEARKRFLREGRLAAGVNHPNSVYVFGTEEIDGTPAIAMELVSGGTLQELVKRDGPLPIGKAVDIILQIVAGLEAAQKLGVLHRDIKPANCFVDADGSVKVGDFGLSISTAARGDSDVTRSGTFLGTPAFSSPEQLRGDELNVRSDMYSVGVTLYFLLTGRTPFEADNMIKLLATVLEKTPESPKKLRPEIPQGLATVVLRCLEKQPTDRFKDYDALRRALRPFTSAAPTAATLGLRFVAAAIDGAILMPALLVLDLLMVRDFDLLIDLQRNHGWLAAGLLFAETAFRVLYFGLWEGLLGASPGKQVCRLKVVGRDRMPPGIARATLRAAILLGLVTLPYWLRFVVEPDGNKVLLFVVQICTWGLMIAIFATARRANGYSGWHDLVTGTQVISRDALQTRPSLNMLDEMTEAAPNSPRIGPYYVLRSLTSADSPEWTLAYDTRLLRRVWIRHLPAGTPAVEASRRSLGRVGRLRWLMGVRSTTENWDAYEAASGTALCDLIQHKNSWMAVRFWLLDLAEELVTASKSGTIPEQLGLDRVWITADGRAKLLDFPAPGIAPMPVAQTLVGKPTKQDTSEQHFLKRVAAAALEGRVVTETPATPPATPLPIHARQMLTSLPQLPNLEPGVAALKEATRHISDVSRGRRALLLLSCCLPSLFFGFIGFLGVFVHQEWQRKHPELKELSEKLSMLQGLDFAKLVPREPGEDKIPKIIAALETVIAFQFGETIRDPAEWNSAYANTIPVYSRARAKKIVAEHSQVSEAEYQAALSEMKKLEGGEGFNSINQSAGTFIRYFGVVLILGWLVWAAIFSVLAAVTFRRGLLLWAIGIDLVRRDGQPASRGRLLLRALITWSPLILFPILIALIIPALQVAKVSGGGELFLFVFGAAGLMYLLLAVVSTSLPIRGIPDRLAGTWPVPR